jgi:hypothetical protein
MKLHLRLLVVAACGLVGACAAGVEVRSPTAEPGLLAIRKAQASPTAPQSGITTAETPMSGETAPQSSPGPAGRAGATGVLDWTELPVLPEFNERARSLYTVGLGLGNEPTAFSRVGDGEVASQWFLTAFAGPPASYDLGSYTDLASVVEYFHAAIARNSQAARAGFNTARILDPAYADPEFCEAGESPLECELRLNQPSFALISLGTNQVWSPEAFESGLRQIIEILLDHSVLPILSTKGDNLEGDQRINRIIVRLAQEYDLPLWNFWRSIQTLPDHGLQPDQEHLTWGPNDFSDPEAMSRAWPVRNLTGLQILHEVMTELSP